MLNDEERVDFGLCGTVQSDQQHIINIEHVFSIFFGWTYKLGYSHFSQVWIDRI